MTAPSSSLAVYFGRNLRALRRRSGLSQEALASRSSLHRTEVSLLERGGREPRLGTMLTGALSVSLDELLSGIKWTPAQRKPGQIEFSGSPDDDDDP